MNSHHPTRTHRLAPLAAAFLALLVSTDSLQAQTDSFRPGAVYTTTNEASGNQIALYDRAVDGTLTFNQFIPTGGSGTDAGLGSQGAVLLTQDERFLLVCNAGSDDISVFQVLETGLFPLGVVSARRSMPVSLTQFGDLVYVLNAGTDSLSGFELDPSGTLTFIIDSRVRLSGNGVMGAQVSFEPSGNHLYVTEKATNLVTHFRVLNDGRAVYPRVEHPTTNSTPFGFAFGKRGQLFLTEAAAGIAGGSTVSSFDLLPDGQLSPISTSISAGQTAACWVVTAPSGRLVYVSNTGSNPISSFSVDFDGTLTVLNAQAATTGSMPTDEAISNDGLFFYVLNSGDGEIGDYRIGSDGSLTALTGSNSGLPTSAAGLAAR